MGWEQRRGRWYFFTKKRTGNRVVSVYVGKISPDGSQPPSTDRTRKATLRDTIRQDEQLMALLRTTTRTFTREILQSRGFHEHRGEWRLSRNQEGAPPDGPPPTT